VIKTTDSEAVGSSFRNVPIMSGPCKLRVEVLGDEIIVILPATSYGVTYTKVGASPHVAAKNFVSKIDAGAPMTHAESSPRRGEPQPQKRASSVGSLKIS
jgi:hypothetical protein